MTTPPQGPGTQPPYPPQGSYPPPPVPEKKKSKAPLIIGITVALLAACLIGVAVSGGGDDSSSSPTPTAGAPGDDGKADEKKDDTAKLNQPVRDGKFEFVVTNVETGLASVGDNPYLNEKAQGEFAVVTVTVKNIGDKAQSFSPSDQKLVDQEGRQHGSDATAQIALGGSDIPVWDDINPGNTVTVKLVFDIPKGAVPTTLELHDSMFSGGAKVSLK